MADQNFNINCGFFDAINNDRLYSADDMTRPYRRVVNDGVFATPSGTASTDLQVVSAGSGMNIIVKKGEGVFGSKWFENHDNITITVPANAESNPRRDSVIAQVDTRRNSRVGRIVYRTGTPSASPQPPAIGTVSGVIEYRISNIYVAAGATYIGNDAIVDLRGSSECPWITGLIKQVDTSQLYNQYRAAYDAYYQKETQLFDQFMSDLTEQLRVNTNIIKYESHYVTTADNQTQIPINIAGYHKATDVLMVRVNRLFASEGIDYSISSDGTYITLTKDVLKGQNIDFVVLQSVVINAEAQTILDAVSGFSAEVSALTSEVAQLNADLTAAENRITTAENRITTAETTLNALTYDSGWINFTLENGAEAGSLAPAVRKYGNQVFLRGMLTLQNSTSTTFATLPAAFKPTQDMIINSNNSYSGSFRYQAVRINATSGAISGSIYTGSNSIPVLLDGISWIVG